MFVPFRVAIMWPAEIHPQPGAIHGHLDGDCPGHRVPESQTDSHAAWIEWHVRPMGDDVENPMAHDERGDDDNRAAEERPAGFRLTPGVGRSLVYEPEYETPDRQQQRVRVRIAHELERRERGITG